MSWARTSGAARRDRRPSWIATKASGGKLLYVADLSLGNVDIFSYPAGTLAGTLTGFHTPTGLCVDKQKDVFVTEIDGSDIVEYARGSTSPKRTLHDGSSSYPNACAVDPTTGDLAVMNNGSGDGTNRGEIAIYRRAQGSPKFYRAMFHPYSCGYDPNGTLFVDGMSKDFRAFHFGELAAGSAAFKPIVVDQSFAIAGGVQWDGTHLAIGDVYGSAIYEFTIAGAQGTEIGATPLIGTDAVWGFSIDRGRKAIAPSSDTQSSAESTVDVYDYPAGGSPVQTIGSQLVEDPVAVALSP